MRSALPGNSSPKTRVALTKATLRIIGFADVVDAIGDLTGLGQASIEKMVRTAKADLTNQPSAEFTAVPPEDQAWAEEVIKRTYIRLAADPKRHIMRESLIGAEAIVQLAEQAMDARDRGDVDAASDDARAYLTLVSYSIAYLISEWYLTNAGPNRAARSQTAGEILRIVRELQARPDDSRAPALVQLEQSTPEEPSSLPELEPIVFELDINFAPLATDAELAELVSAAVVAVLEDRPVLIEVSLPTLDEDLKGLGDAVQIAQYKRKWQNRARRLQLVLSAFFSPQVEAAWAGTYMQGLSDRVSVVRALLAGPESATTGRLKLEVFRTTPSRLSAPIRLTPDETHAVLESVGLQRWDHLMGGAGWRAADELPCSILVEKVMPSILTELVQQEVTSEEDWAAEVLSLPSWHISSD